MTQFDYAPVGNAVHVLSGLPAMVEGFRDAVRNPARGPWKIEVKAGYERSLFVNTKTAAYTVDLDFTASREALEEFLLTAGRQAFAFLKSAAPVKTLLKSGLPNVGAQLNILNAAPSADTVEALRNSFAAAVPQADAGAEALATYRGQLAKYGEAFAGVEKGFADEAPQCLNAVEEFLAKQPAGREYSLQRAEAFRTTFETTLATVKQKLVVEAPADADRMHTAMTVLAGALHHSLSVLPSVDSGAELGPGILRELAAGWHGVTAPA